MGTNNKSVINKAESVLRSQDSKTIASTSATTGDSDDPHRSSKCCLIKLILEREIGVRIFFNKRITYKNIYCLVLVCFNEQPLLSLNSHTKLLAKP